LDAIPTKSTVLEGAKTPLARCRALGDDGMTNKASREAILATGLDPIALQNKILKLFVFSKLLGAARILARRGTPGAAKYPC
jgi:hypothetical protein